ncbi:MAG: rSAM/selenodomain-associated transferase 1 [Oleispira sp.]|jgi:rSAM/selenodomain-associated transferase 1
MVKQSFRIQPDNKIIEWVVLTKAPIPGLVKTRLIPTLGEQGACDVYEQLLIRLETSLKAVIENAQLSSSQIALSQVALWVAGDADHAAFKPWAGLATFYQQPQLGDLGERMALAVQSSLARGFIPVLIGVDVPDLDEAYLSNCLQQFKQHDLVISPAEDGGYGLLGMTQFYPELFVSKRWGTDTVFTETLRDIQRLEIKAAYLPKVWDVDEIADVERYFQNCYPCLTIS